MQKTFTDTDRRFMRLALRLAQKGKGWTSPNPNVGAVIVKDGNVVGRGVSRPAGQRHAEFFALQEAGPQARGATLYTTLEPCCHFGRTPPCTTEIIAAKIRRVVSAIPDPNPLVGGGGFAELRRVGIISEVGLCAEEATRQIEDFLKFVTTGTPFVTLKLATTLDGKIATHAGESKWITGKAARRYAHRLRHEHDAVAVGIGTVLKDDPLLTARHTRKVRNPHRVIIDSKARTPLTARALRESPLSGGETMIAVSRSANRDRVEALRAAGSQVIVAPTRASGIDLRWLMRFLAKKGCMSVLLEGGSEIAGSALDAGIVDKVFFFVAPKIIGGRDAVSAVGGKGVARIDDALRVCNWKVRRLGEDIMVEGYLSTSS